MKKIILILIFCFVACRGNTELKSFPIKGGNVYYLVECIEGYKYLITYIRAKDETLNIIQIKDNAGNGIECK